MLIIQDGFAIRYEDEVKPTWDYSHLLATPTQPAAKPKKDEKPAKPKKAKREDFQMQLF